MKFKELLCNPAGELSHGKLWSNVAFSVTSYVVIKLANANSQWLPEIFFAYLVVVSGSEVGKKFITMKYGTKDEKEDT